MGYKHQNLLYDVKGRKQCSSESIIEKMSKTQVNLKIIPDIDGSQAIAQLVGYNLTDIQVKGGWSGAAAIARARQRTGCGPSGAQGAWCGSFHCRPDIALWPRTTRLQFCAVRKDERHG